MATSLHDACLMMISLIYLTDITKIIKSNTITKHTHKKQAKFRPTAWVLLSYNSSVNKKLWTNLHVIHNIVCYFSSFLLHHKQNLYLCVSEFLNESLFLSDSVQSLISYLNDTVFWNQSSDRFNDSLIESHWRPLGISWPPRRSHNGAGRRPWWSWQKRKPQWNQRLQQNSWPPRRRRTQERKQINQKKTNQEQNPWEPKLV